MTTLPANALSPAFLSAGRDSPVSAAWSTAAIPSITVPSTGIFSPVNTRTVMPGLTDLSGTFFSMLFSRIQTSLTLSPTRRLILVLARLAAREVSISEKFDMARSVRLDSGFPARTDAVTAVTVSVSAFGLLSFTAPAMPLLNSSADIRSTAALLISPVEA